MFSHLQTPWERFERVAFSGHDPAGCLVTPQKYHYLKIHKKGTDCMKSQSSKTSNTFNNLKLGEREREREIGEGERETELTLVF